MRARRGYREEAEQPCDVIYSHITGEISGLEPVLVPHAIKRTEKTKKEMPQKRETSRIGTAGSIPSHMHYWNWAPTFEEGEGQKASGESQRANIDYYQAEGGSSASRTELTGCILGEHKA